MFQKYGPWAVVAGASEGIGAAYARALAAQGINLVLTARRREPLQELAGQLPVETRTIAADLSTPDGLQATFATASGLEVGLVIANAALSPMGPFWTADPAELEQALDLNCRAPMLLARHFLPAMIERKRGGFLIMSSLAGQQGSPGLSAYAATKAFDTVLAEGLWGEARAHGVDVLTCTAGAVATPNLARSASKQAPGTKTPEYVVQTALRQLGKGPRVVPGGLMKFSAQVMARLMPRRTAVDMMGKASRSVLE